MNKLDYEIVDNLPIRVRGGRVSANMVKLARANPGKWIRRNFEYKSSQASASVGRRLEKRNPGIVATSRERFVYIMFPGNVDA